MQRPARHAQRAAHPLEGGIPCDFRDDYLELRRLLIEAAGIEHSLMVAYLYAMFSLKPEHAAIAGDLSSRSYLQNSPLGPTGTRPPRQGRTTLLDIAIEEMQHLSLVNKLLVGLGAAPHVLPHVQPLSGDLYPFPIEPRPLDRYAAASFLWLEASTGSLSLHPAAEGERESPELIRDVRDVIWNGGFQHRLPPLDQHAVSHVGSIYRVILRQLRKVADQPPEFVSPDFPWGEWEQRLRWVMGQGETGHYRFFRDLFTGELLGGPDAWAQGVSRERFEWRSAYPGRRDSIRDEPARRLAWLSNLHYWVILCLLELSYRDVDHRLRYTAIDHMTTSLWRIGRHLADRSNVGLPFDAMSSAYALGRSAELGRGILARLLAETQRCAHELDAHRLLPHDYDLMQFTYTAASLGVTLQRDHEPA